MPTIGWIGSIQIRIYYDDHGTPHFHAVSPEFDCKIAIADLTVISGNGRIRGRDLADVRAWAQSYRAALISAWQAARDGKPMQRSRGDMLYRIADAIAHEDHTVTITWSDGVTAAVDLSSVIATGPVFAPLRAISYFAGQMRIAPDRLGLEWPNDVDFSADGLRFRAFPDEGTAEFGLLKAS